MSQILDWLKELDLEQYGDRFVANGIDASVLGDLTDQDLEKLGVLLGHRRKILRAIAENAEQSKNAAAFAESESKAPSHTFNPPKSYTQTHLEQQVTTVRAPLEGERKQVTVRVKIIGSLPASKALDPILRNMRGPERRQ